MKEESAIRNAAIYTFRWIEFAFSNSLLWCKGSSVLSEREKNSPNSSPVGNKLGLSWFGVLLDVAVKINLLKADFSGRESLRAEPERIGANGEAAPQGEGQQKSEHRLVLAFFWCTSRDSPGCGVSRRFVRRGALPPLCAAAQPSGSLYPPPAALASGHPGPAD